jgi:hypothetical protein
VTKGAVFRMVQLTSVVMLVTAVLAPAPGVAQSAFSYPALRTRLPVLREHRYVVNAKVRPLLLFWIGRDDVGDARITWRQGPDGSRAFEFLVGTDPARAPRRINRWGFIVEELRGAEAEILGLMTESSEETIDQAKAKIERRDDVAVFKASRTTLVGNRGVNGTITLRAPAHLTYRDLDTLLDLIPASLPTVRAVAVPSSTHQGFLVAMDALLRATVGPCRTVEGGRRKDVPAVRYLYNQTVYELSLESCRTEPQFRTATDTFADVVDGRFQLTNTRTKRETNFRVAYGASGDLSEVPVRAIFRPRWWIEVELVIVPGRSAEKAVRQ